MGTSIKLAIKFAFVAAFLILAVPTRAGPVSATADEPVGGAVDVEEIDQFVGEQVERHGIPGLALALVDGDQVILIKGYGQADPSGRPVTPQTPFILASISKPLTATAILQLVEAGRVELDAPVQRYLPDFRVADPAASAQITVRHLLLHTSGLPSTACDTRADATSIAEYLAELQTIALEAPPGTRHIYCSGNYNILGRIVEVVSGQSFGDYMQANIFAPLEMKQSFASEQEAQQFGLAQGYQWFFGLPLSIRYPYNPSQLPSGYLIASAEDLSHFLVSQLNAGQYLRTRLLSAESVTAMQVAGIERDSGGGYGFGWVIAPVGDVPSVWHDGVNVNFHSLLLMQPAHRRGAVLLMNSFGIVAYESAYKEIKTGVSRMLAGMEPPEDGPDLGTLYLQVDVLLAGLLAVALWPLIRIQRWNRRLHEQQPTRTRSRAGASLRAAWEMFLALAVLIGIRTLIVTGLGAQSWYEFFTVFPDFSIWIWSCALVILLTGVIRMKLVFQMHRRATPAQPGQPVRVE